MLAKKQLSIICLLLVMLIAQPLATLACATCGCSEVCPLSMIQETDTSETKGKVGLSDSLWGSIILKMAYQRDAQLQKLSKHLKGTNAVTSAAVYGAAGGTLGQNIISMAVLNPDFGNDSYLPGALGMGLSGLLNVALDGGIVINWHMKKKINARKLAIREKVETLLDHLEYSEASCPDAQKQLAEVIGDRGAADCLKLWHLSHSQLASNPQRTTGMLDKPNLPLKDQLSQVETKSTPVQLLTSQKVE